jgi:hypothetical protein
MSQNSCGMGHTCMKYIHLFVIALFMLSSCSEDSINTTSSTNGGKPYLEVSPSSINLAPYQEINLKYRVANFPYDDQLRIVADFGNGDTLDYIHNHHSVLSFYYYKEPGTYTLKLSAYDSFVDTLLATKNVPVTISSQPLVASISPMALDTIYNKDIGSEYYLIYYSVSTNVDLVPLTYTWTISGNGYYRTEVGDGGLYLRFPSKGTYKVVMTIQDYSVNKQLTADSTTITIR